MHAEATTPNLFVNSRSAHGSCDGQMFCGKTPSNAHFCQFCQSYFFTTEGWSHHLDTVHPNEMPMY
ncbi:hypothetical protein DL89DRAFT_268455 [Linderina pennispora]|uniref:C2H2-type domain-containing protein n=1 Tax=Linderina pennispora TaxID=61395 RepID=A0A1Y1W690_9FUNG|nr:uncharacterized protein DL89DRAFT_268455 [Linderina pennispora]ORX68674.1 hypothetical protein DL89DRAFT_268455 [Linderina pennispora]